MTCVMFQAEIYMSLLHQLNCNEGINASCKLLAFTDNYRHVCVWRRSECGAAVRNECGAAVCNEYGAAVCNECGAAVCNECGAGVCNECGAAVCNECGTAVRNECHCSSPPHQA